jgi:CBS domain-containing protein
MRESKNITKEKPMRALDVMTSSVITASPEMNVRDAAKRLVDNHISGMPVVDASGKVVGIVSEGDLLHRVEIGTGTRRRSWWLEFLTSNRQLASTYVREHAHLVKDVMNENVISVNEDTPLVEIADLLERCRIKRVPVLKDGALVGVVSRANLIRALASVKPDALPSSSTSEQEIRAAVVRALREQRWALPSENVIVTGGVVHLWGVIESEEERRAIRITAEGVPGVKSVESHLEYPPVIPVL